MNSYYYPRWFVLDLSYMELLERSTSLLEMIEVSIETLIFIHGLTVEIDAAWINLNPIIPARVWYLILKEKI